MIIIYELTHESSLTHKPTAHYIYRYIYIHIYRYRSTHIYPLSILIHTSYATKDRISDHSFYFIARSWESEEVNQF